jgi:4-aminobutyrate--pyruvate transaminase
LQVNQRGFDLPLPFVKHVTCPHHYRFAEAGESDEAFADRLAAELEATILGEGAETVAAFIGEPLMGAGGVLAPPEGYWRKVQEVCRRHDVLIVADEVINGFGRLGTLFACEHYGIQPDILVLSKQITSSYQPLAAVLVSDALYQGIADQTERLGNFGHGFTASGHPVATAVALENLAIIEEHSLVTNAAKVGLYLFERAQEHGLIVRAVQDSIAFCPPLIITPAQVDDVVRRFDRALADTQSWVTGGMPGA